MYNVYTSSLSSCRPVRVTSHCSVISGNNVEVADCSLQWETCMHGDADLAGVIIIICVYYGMTVAHQYSTLKNETLKYTRNIKYTQLNNQWEAKFA